LLAQLGLDRSQAPKAALPSRLNTYLDRRRSA
jgi:hypothetical protein